MTDIKYTVKDDRISVYAYGTDKFKSENISIYFEVPEIKKKNVARSLLLSVLKRGTEKYNSQQSINERLDELYATLVNLKNQKFDGKQLLGVSADVIYPEYTEEGSDILPDVLDVISQILFHPNMDAETGKFNQRFVESEKENYKSIILSQINEPRTYAAIRCREEMFSSLGVVDKLDTMCDKIDAASVDEIYECYCEILKNAKILVFYVGKRTENEVLEKVAQVFPNRDVEILSHDRKAPKLLDELEEPKIIMESSDVSQSRLVMGFNCGVTWRDDDYYAMLLCNEILGSSPISKLMVNIREKLSLCYECSSVYNSSRGALFVTTGIDSVNYELVKNAIVEQVNDIVQGKISETEFLSAKKSIFNVYSALCDSPSAIERFYLGRIINGINIGIDDFLAKIDSVTVDDIKRAAGRLSLHTVFYLCGEGECEDE